jgi:predicted branched-subunit amino acid permease
MRVLEPRAMTVVVWGGCSLGGAIQHMGAGAPVWVILATGFCVNLRFVVFSLHLRQFLIHLPRWQRMVHGYLTADISYVLFVRKYAHPAETPHGRLEQEAYLAGNDFLNWLSWIVASFVGIALANLIPPSWGLGFAGILCLLGIQCSLASSRMRMLSAAVAGVAAVVTYSLPLKLNIVVAIAAAVILCLTVEKMRPAPGVAA